MLWVIFRLYIFFISNYFLIFNRISLVKLSKDRVGSFVIKRLYEYSDDILKSFIYKKINESNIEYQIKNTEYGKKVL